MTANIEEELRDWPERVREADEFLKEQGISVRPESPWSAESGRLHLAGIVRRALGSPEVAE